VNAPNKYGVVKVKNNQVIKFSEKPMIEDAIINGGFFVINKNIFNYIDDDNDIFETNQLKILADKNDLAAYLHEGFWQSMDTLRDKKLLEEYWKNNKAEWKIWS